MPTEATQWISSNDAVEIVTKAYMASDKFDRPDDERYEIGNRAAVNAIMRRLVTGDLAARCNSLYWKENDKFIDCKDCEIENFFWLKFDPLNWDHCDWVAGDFGLSIKGLDSKHAIGVHFDRRGLPGIAQSILANIANEPASPAIGAPRKWDWDGALIHLAALAHVSPDGLLRSDQTDPNQTDIANILSDWFIDNNGNAPASSALRQYGSRFVAELNALKLKAANKSA